MINGPATAYAETVNYWQTSKASTDTWLERSKKEIVKAGGQVIGEGFLSETTTGRSSFMLAFALDGDQFRMLWPVLQSKKGNVRAARIQAATALYHEVKVACVKARFLGARAAFFAYLVLPDGRVAADIAVPELIEAIPRLFLGPGRETESQE